MSKKQNILKRLLSYRIPSKITTAVVYQDNSIYYHCPRCGTPIEREFQAFCVKCGQHLNWNNYEEAIITSCFSGHDSMKKRPTK